MVNFPPPVWDEIEEEADVAGVGVGLIRVTCPGHCPLYDVEGRSQLQHRSPVHKKGYMTG